MLPHQVRLELRPLKKENKYWCQKILSAKKGGVRKHSVFKLEILRFEVNFYSNWIETVRFLKKIEKSWCQFIDSLLNLALKVL